MVPENKFISFRIPKERQYLYILANLDTPDSWHRLVTMTFSKPIILT